MKRPKAGEIIELISSSGNVILRGVVTDWFPRDGSWWVRVIKPYRMVTSGTTVHVGKGIRSGKWNAVKGADKWVDVTWNVQRSRRSMRRRTQPKKNPTASATIGRYIKGL